MAHQRPRHLQGLVEKMLRFGPIVGLLGHRQVGKTTLIERVAALTYRSPLKQIAVFWGFQSR